MSDIKQQQKEQLRVRLKAAEKRKRSAALEAAGRVTVRMISQARKNGDTELYAKLIAKYKAQESIGDFIDKQTKELMKKYTENLPKI